jgi:succinate-semialdehyde dehydrogenase/glutarate-semialdehyde dehydrogenase
MRSLNPATGETIRECPDHLPAEVDLRLAVAYDAFAEWRRRPMADRGHILRDAATMMKSNRDRFARLMTEEMGKPIGQAEAEVDKCAWVCEHFAEHAATYLAPEAIVTDAAKSYVRYDPLGVLLAVMPWNFPFWQVFRAAAPALMAGNVVVLKHASNVPGAALVIEEIFRDAGAPIGVFTTLLVPGKQAEDLVDDARIACVTLTGSEAAGMALAARAGRAIKKSVMELGGSDAFIVLDDADPEQAAHEAAAARIINNGQSCIAAKRFIVAAPIADRFAAAFTQRMAVLRVGDPMDRATELGPLARADLRDDLHVLVERTVRAGGTLATGGHPLPGRGFFYAPTVITDVEPGMAAFDEETFGPVAAVIRARDDAHAVELANRSRYGLGASVWSRDPRRAEVLAGALEAGSVFVNGIVKSDPRLPFGGVKRSGFGRELAAAGIREFVNVKTVWVGASESLPRSERSGVE